MGHDPEERIVHIPMQENYESVALAVNEIGCILRIKLISHKSLDEIFGLSVSDKAVKCLCIPRNVRDFGNFQID